MAHTVTWDSTYEAIPADGDQASTLGDVIRDLKRDIRERAEIDHDWDDTTNAGKHNQVTLQQLGAKPTSSANEGYVYQKNVGSVGELFYENESGTETQLTELGVIPVASIGEYVTDLALKNAIALTGEDTGASPIDLVQINASDEIDVGDIANAIPLRLNTDGASTLVVEYGSGDQKIFHAGNDGTGSGLDADTVDGIEAIAILSSLSSGAGAFFESSNQSISNSASASIAHSLGSVPRMVTGVLKCIAANEGYSIDDEVQMGHAGHGQSSRGLVFGADSSGNVFYKRGSDVIFINNKSDGSDVAIDLSKWKLVLRAWK